MCTRTPLPLTVFLTTLGRCAPWSHRASFQYSKPQPQRPLHVASCDTAPKLPCPVVSPQALARVVYVHICLLLETEAQASPTRSLVWRAEQCLREWDRLERSGLTQGAGVLDPRHVAALQRWAKTADSDLYLAEALHGSALPPTKTLQVGAGVRVTPRDEGHTAGSGGVKVVWC